MIKKHVGTNAFVSDSDGVAFFSDCFANGLYRYSPKDGSISFVDFFPDIPKNERNIHLCAVFFDNRFFFLCNQRPIIHSVISGTNIIEEIKCGRDAFVYAFVKNGKLFFLTEKGDLWIYKNGIIDLYEDKNESLKEFMKDGIGNISSHKSGIIICSKNGDSFFCVNFENGINELIKSPCDGVFLVKYIDNKYWMLIKDSFDIKVWNRKKTITIKNEKGEWISDVFSEPYSDMVVFNDDVIVLNYYATRPLKISRYDYRVSSLFEENHSYSVARKREHYGGLFIRFYEDDRYLFFLPYKSSKYYRISKVNGKIEDYTSYADVSDSYLEQIGILFEEDFYVDDTRNDDTGFILTSLISKRPF